MDFFAQQDHARRMTRRLVILFVCAVVAVVAAVNIAAVALFGWDVSAHVAVSLITLVVILGGSLYRVLQLRSGGTAVAELVGGRRIRPDTVDREERRLLNVVEEMAIASGITVPVVYVLDRESGINAFAAGYSPNEAVVAVTRGTLTQLTRDELQGVIAHEFSHILNGDMRLNIRMMGVLAGILLIAGIGEFVMRASRGGRSNTSSRDRDSGGFFLFGIALLIVGYVGKFLADLIKAAVSRQREFLADAAAVQFTRNPEGIGLALIKIGAGTSRLDAPGAAELSHMWFAGGVKFAALFATHPPITERVERVLGVGRARVMARSFAHDAHRGSDAVASSLYPPSHGATWLAEPGAAFESGPRGMPGSPMSGRLRLASDDVLATVGNPTRRHIRYAEALLGELPAALREHIGSETGAKAGLLALLLEGPDLTGAKRRLILEAGAHEALALAEASLAALARLGPAARLPILELAIPALKSLTAQERKRLLALLRDLILADQRVDAFEFVLLAILVQQLDDGAMRTQGARHRALDAMAGEIATVLSMFIRAASQGSLLFDRSMRSLGLSGPRLTAASALDYQAVLSALIELKGLAPLDKPRVIRACLDIVMVDGEIAVLEAELLRGVCAMLDSPMPPVLEPQ